MCVCVFRYIETLAAICIIYIFCIWAITDWDVLKVSLSLSLSLHPFSHISLSFFWLFSQTTLSSLSFAHLLTLPLLSSHHPLSLSLLSRASLSGLLGSLSHGGVGVYRLLAQRYISSLFSFNFNIFFFIFFFTLVYNSVWILNQKRYLSLFSFPLSHSLTLLLLHFSALSLISSFLLPYLLISPSLPPSTIQYFDGCEILWSNPTVMVAETWERERK